MEETMEFQISKDIFKKALLELGHDPDQYEGKKITLSNMCDIYSFSHDELISEIEKKYLSAHYDYKNDNIWVDALEAAHFFYCKKSDILDNYGV